MNRLLGRFVKVRVLNGIRLRLINPLEYHQRLLLFEAPYEPEVTHFLDTVLGNGMVFVDVGANLGYYTLLAAKRVGPNGQVHAFEPAPAQFRHLEMNVRLNRAGNVILNRCAVTDHGGQVDLFLSDGWNHGTHSIGAGRGPRRSLAVDCTSLDEYIDRARVSNIDVIKIDVEGAELSVFRGAERMLTHVRPSVVIFEACEEHAQACGYSTRDVKRLLHGCGYQLFRVEGACAPKPADIAMNEVFANLIGIHKEAPARWCKGLTAALQRCASRQLGREEEGTWRGMVPEEIRRART